MSWNYNISITTPLFIPQVQLQNLSSFETETSMILISWVNQRGFDFGFRSEED